MGERSLFVEAEHRAQRAEAALERVLAVTDVMQNHQSAHVRSAAASIRTVIAQGVTA